MIVRQSPEAGLDETDQAWFESDADGNDSANREIDTEAARHGLIRVKEYWLQTLRLPPDGKIVRRGFCYRPAESELSTLMAARREGDPVSTPTNELIRQLRDTGE